MRLPLALLLACLVVPSSARAQLEPLAAIPEPSATPEAPPPLIVHLDAELSSYGAALVRTLARRIGIEVELGAAPPGRNALALPVGHVGIVPTEAHDRGAATVVWVGERGRVFETEVVLPAGRAAALRALVLAVVDLRDAVLEAPPLEDEPIFELAPEASEGRGGYVYLEPPGGLFGRRRTIESIARPTIYFRALIGFSSSGQGFVVGPGVGVGLCIGDQCVVIEGELPVLESQRVDVVSGLTFSYRALNLALRLQLRPIRIDDVTIGATLGLLSRVGGAWASDGSDRVISSFGVRSSIEMAWQFERPFEWVVEGGVDAPFQGSEARFIQDGPEVRLDDDVTVWGVTALRIRP